MAVMDEKKAAAAAASQQQQQAIPRNDMADALVTDGFQLPDIDPGDGAPPPYGESHDQVHFSQPGFDAGAEVTGMYPACVQLS